MIKPLLLRLGLVSLVATASCRHIYVQEDWRIEGSLSDASGAPVSGATVTLACPLGAPATQIATTNGSGRFVLFGESSTMRVAKCSLLLEAPGRMARSVAVASACLRTYGDVIARPCLPADGLITF